MIGATESEMPKMPKLETLRPLAPVANTLQLQDALAHVALTRNQYVVMMRHLATYLPADIQLDQRTPKSVVTVTVVTRGAKLRFTVNNRARVSLPDILGNA
jgi:hypothetical protein